MRIGWSIHHTVIFAFILTIPPNIVNFSDFALCVYKQLSWACVDPLLFLLTLYVLT